MLNLFAHTCGYSRAASRGGEWCVEGGTNVDLDPKWMDMYKDER